MRTPEQPNPLANIGLRDGLRQIMCFDNMALVRAIGRGVDVDGDGSEDLRRDGVVYYAQSLGGIYGTMLMGVDQRVRAAPSTCRAGRSWTSPASRRRSARWWPPTWGTAGPACSTAAATASRSRCRCSATRRSHQARARGRGYRGRLRLCQLAQPHREPRVLRAAPAPHPARRRGAKKVLYQFAYGDETVPNPTSATLMRAGGLQDVTTFYRNDRTPTAGTNPHGFLLDPTLTGRNLGQAQVLDFLSASGGATISDPDGPAPIFEVPIADPASLETLNFSPRPGHGVSRPRSRRHGRHGVVHRRRHRHGRPLRLAGGVPQRHGAPARAAGAVRVLAPRGRQGDRRGLPGVGRAAGRRQPADRPLHGPQPVVHLERPARP